MIKFLIEKEFKQLFRNSFLPKLIFIFPCMIMILMPWAANLEIKNINLNIVDNDHSVLSRRLVDKIGASTYFRLTALPDTYDEALLAIEAGSADVVLEIPRDFEKDWVKGEAPRLLVAANAVNGTKGSLGGSYLSSIISDYTRELGSESSSQGLAGKPLSRVDITTQNLYNPTLNYKLFMIPALMVMLLTLICGFLPALNVVGEKEVGTIEQINVTPRRQVHFHCRQADTLLADRPGGAHHLFCAGMAALRHSAGGTFPHYLRHGAGFSTGGVGVRAGHIQSFGNVAAGHVRHVVLHACPYSDERSFYSYPQHARMGAMDYAYQSAALFCGGNAYHLSPWRRICRTAAAVGSLVGLCIGLQSVGGKKL